LGILAGFNLTTGDNNIDIGNAGAAAEANAIRIGRVHPESDINPGALLPAHTVTFIAGISWAGAGFAPNDLLFLPAGAPSVAGFTKIGTTQQQIKNLTGQNLYVTLDVYQKN
jgi:hypothetical protein